MADKNRPDLDGAYALKGADEAVEFYAAWAGDYDSGFVESHDYILHREVARAFVEHGGTGPILDLGAGTGLLGEELKAASVAPVDGTDISDAMLEQAAAKGVYRHVFTGDLTARLPVEGGAYNGLVSAGTFTTGHVGPDALDEVLRMAAPDALIALSITPRHFESAGFAAKLDALLGAITPPVLEDVPIYGQRGSGAHAQDRAYVAVFRKR